MEVDWFVCLFRNSKYVIASLIKLKIWTVVSKMWLEVDWKQGSAYVLWSVIEHAAERVW